MHTNVEHMHSSISLVGHTHRQICIVYVYEVELGSVILGHKAHTVLVKRL